MKTINGDIKVFSSGEELSALRYTKLQKYLAIECSAGGLVPVLERVRAFMKQGDSASAELELNNALFSLNSILNDVPILSRSFAICVAEIGGKVCSDISEDGLDSIISQLSLSYGDMKKEVDSLKKKLSQR